MKVGDIARIKSDKVSHLYKGKKVRIVKILSPKNEKPILVEPLDGIIGGWFETNELEIID